MPEKHNPVRGGAAGAVFLAFLGLGLTSFGGPIAHLGYFREAFVVRRRWLGEEEYGQVVALCQFLPGPASSQVGFAVGVSRAGLLGGLAAWAGFTLPSALSLVIIAALASGFSGPVAEGLFHGLKLVAVAVVAKALWGMGRTLTPDIPRLAVAIGALALVLLIGGPFAQIVAIAVGALLGLIAAGNGPLPRPLAPWSGIRHRAAIVALVAFAVLLLGSLMPWPARGIAEFLSTFYRSGALVFGGGHVVLPLLDASLVPERLPEASFLTGYGLAQAVPGPLFSFAAYLGFEADGAPTGMLGAGLALVAIFLPGLLLVYGVLPFWQRLTRRQPVAAAMRGANAAVVGVLAAALYDPVWSSSVGSVADAIVAAAGFAALTIWRLPSWAVVLALALAGIALRLAGL